MQHDAPGRPGDAWLWQALGEAKVRELRHPDQIRYAFRLGTKLQRKRVRIDLPSLPYLKDADVTLAV